MKRCLIGICLLAHTLFCQGNISTKHNEQPLQPQQATHKTIFQKHLIKTTVGALISIAGIILLYRRYKSPGNGNNTIKNSDSHLPTHTRLRSQEIIKEQDPKKGQDMLISFLHFASNNSLFSLFNESQEPKIRSEIIKCIKITSEATSTQTQLEKLADEEKNSTVKAIILRKICEYKLLHSKNLDKPLNEFISTFKSNKDETIRLDLLSIFDRGIITLKNTKHQAIRELLHATAINKAYSSKLRIAAIHALSSFKEEMLNVHLTSLIDILKNDSSINTEGKKFIIEVLKKSKDKKSTSALEYVQKNHSNKDIRNAAKSVLDEMNQEIKKLLQQLEDPNLKIDEFTKLANLLNKQSTKDLDDIKPVMKFIEAQTNENRRQDAFSRLEGILFSDETIENWLIKMLKESTNKLQNGNNFHVKQQVNNIVKNLGIINHNKAVEILEEMIKDQNSKKNQNIIISLISGLGILKQNSKLITLFKDYKEPKIRRKIINSINTESEDITIQNQLQELANKEKNSSVKAAILRKIYQYKFLDTKNLAKTLNEFISTFKENQDETIRLYLLSFFDNPVVSTLKNIEHKAVRELLYQTAINQSYSPDLRLIAVNALYSFKNGNPTDLILNELIKDLNEEVRSGAIISLKWEVFEEEEVLNTHLTTLINLLKNDSSIDTHDKKSIIEALKKGKDKKIISALEYVHKNDPDEAVRNAAKSALDEINSKK